MTYVVIFKAKILEINNEYLATAKQLREKALSQYQCIQFNSCYENGEEISLSYWNSLEEIQSWKKDLDHLKAQSEGQKNWYSQYSIEICEIKRSYKNP